MHGRHLGGPTVLCYRVNMVKSIRDNTKKRGRPVTTGKGTLIGVRLQAGLLSLVDRWRRQQTDLPGRPEAIRRLVESGLAGGSTATRRRNKESKRKAAELAGREIDRLGDRGLTGEEKATRKRRLIKGPREFRDMRGDLPKTKS